MKSYRYRLIVGEKKYSQELGNYEVKIKSFLGDDKNALYEKFEFWFIKQSYDRENIKISFDEVQHIGY